MLRKGWIRTLGLVLAVPAMSIAQEQQIIKKGGVSNGSINTFSDCTAVTNLVTNCRFDTGDFGGWNQCGDLSASSVVSGCGVSGMFCAHMGPVFYNGTLTQSLPTFGTCLLSFWLRNSGAPSRFSVEWNAKTVLLLDPVPNFSYQQITIPSLPGGAAAYLTFTFYNGPSFIDLTDIVVQCM
jgi:hypothetical protein